MEKSNLREKIKREKIIVISVLVIILIVILVLVAFKLEVFSGSVIQNPDKAEEFSYQKYKQICSKDDDYFEELAGLAGGGSKKVREIKEKSIFCQTSEKQEITKEQLEDMACECLEREIKKCQQGWQLIGNFCYKGKDMTSILKKCSFYKCEGNYYVEVERKEV